MSSASLLPGCRYESRHHEEGALVGTSEPCLRCQCLDGSLRCRLRICRRLPEPPPPGCRLLSPADHDCCPQIVCGPQSGCLHEGVRYGPGSAMMGSRRCEYCYCISGARRCIRPKCLLPLPGCAPLYAPHSCCPVAYNCTREYISPRIFSWILSEDRYHDLKQTSSDMFNCRSSAWKEMNAEVGATLDE
ncbi:hypothetical protein QAD02_017175 [Eretmocerus hayati]|uniref:Uncharacterized protein n=1 Tax=Eretmocerus hayati TaxID=131215 RepID=A0ACC2PE80_9HYME|nr:hypothetical protein QAD02_017175 [Eretmocerus hayati]